MSTPAYEIDPTKLRQSFDRHRASPEITLEQYVRARQIELGESVLKRRRVYLDKRFWILLRDAAVGCPTSSSTRSLLSSLRAQVGCGETICPISESLFMELLKQEDLSTRRATAELIDELSEGVTLLVHPQRVATEMAHFIHMQAGINTHALETLVWSKLSYVFGVQHPVNETYDPDEMCVIQKVFFDHMWECSLVEIVDRLADASPPVVDHDALALRLNEQSALHAESIKSFSQTYAAEIRGSLSLVTSVAREVIEHIATHMAGKPIESTEFERREHEEQLLTFLCDAIKRKEVAVALRTLHVGALCHAAVRWDKKRRLTGNDLFDFHHAEAAIGYCDFFLTEGPLCSMLQQGHLRLTKDFPCKVISSLKIAAASFSAIDASQETPSK